jgi:hypothetical protein
MRLVCGLFQIHFSAIGIIQKEEGDAYRINNTYWSAVKCLELLYWVNGVPGMFSQIERILVTVLKMPMRVVV